MRANVPDLTARQLHAVLAVAEYNSFIAAAAFLKTSQPALTRTIKRVEDVLGVLLFDRSTRRVAITAAGKEFVAVAERMLNDLRISISSMREIGEQPIARHGWSRNDIKSYLWLNSGNRFDAISRGHRYGKVYNRNLPKWYKREPDSRIPIVESPDWIHLFVIGGHAGRFSAFIPGWGHMSTPVLRPIAESSTISADRCGDGMCKL